MAEWLRSGLQIRGHRFESGRRLQRPLQKEPYPTWMLETMNKDYVLSIIRQIDNPANSDLLQMIESIDVSEQTVKIIIKSELNSAVENTTSLWKTLIEKDSRIKSCSIIFTKHSAPNLKKNLSQKHLTCRLAYT